MLNRNCKNSKKGISVKNELKVAYSRYIPVIVGSKIYDEKTTIEANPLKEEAFFAQPIDANFYITKEHNILIEKDNIPDNLTISMANSDCYQLCLSKSSMQGIMSINQ